MTPDSGLASLRDRIALERNLILSGFKDQLDSRATLSSLADHLDSVISILAHESLQEHQVGLFSLGGCGRREVFPFSDVDLLFLHGGGTLPPELEKGIGSMLGNLYDLGLSVGQQVWPVQDLKSIDVEEISLLLALMDGRFIWGEMELADEFRETREGLFTRHRPGLIDAILQITQARHREHGNTIYELEPDVKHSPGGLRDHLVIHWMSLRRR